jgi:hypothetical protein
VSYLGYLCLFPFICIQNILCCILVFLRLVYIMLPVSLDCPFLIAPSISSNVQVFTQCALQTDNEKLHRLLDFGSQRIIVSLLCLPIAMYTH